MNLESSSKLIAGILRNCIKRFPVSVVYVVALTAVLLVKINCTDVFDERFLYVASYYLSVGYLLSLTLHLWQEETRGKLLVSVVNVLAHAALIADAVYLYNLPESHSFMETGIAHVSAIFALWLSLFFLSFLKEKDNVASWNFTMRILSQFAVSHVVGLVMFLGLSLLATSLLFLFGIDVKSDCYLSLAVVFCLFLSSCLFIGLIPEGEAKHDRVPVISKFMNGVMHYLFLPLIGCYLVVLYVYAFRIIHAWELPDGWVSYLVVALMAGCIGIEFGLYPVRQKEHKLFDEFVLRWLPLVILPLLALMTVGIVRRFQDYGISVNRLYLATLNAWCYFVCVGLFITKARRINWITISFSLVFLLTSALPMNYVSITRETMRRNVLDDLQKLGMTCLPMGQEEYKAFMDRIPEEKMVSVSGQLEYMRDWFGKEFVADIADEDIPFWNYRNKGTRVDGVYYADYSAKIDSYSEVEIPKGYSRMVEYGFESSDEFSSDYEGIVKFVAPINKSATSDTIYLDIKKIKNIKKPYNKPLVMKCSAPEDLFMLTQYSLTLYKGERKTRIYVSGYLFKK
ncbi:MAG: DUF4153 domain-containing protein [Bacteroides sp.]|nr:DUF4153 domain-containing protein [Roseburia sp.]MCM1347206.1 DUF4153 domain-containing protein [Bacteroides sp.]MCM1421658.1 DUF4153 domain-containing protein [Bacteroides sp.]